MPVPLQVGLADVVLACLLFTGFIVSQVAVFAIADGIQDWRRKRRGAG